MKIQHLRTEQHPFRQLAIASFIKGGLSILLGAILLLSSKTDVKAGHSVIAAEKIMIALGLISIGGLSLWRGYQQEYDFNLSGVWDPSHDVNVNYLLGQRSTDSRKLAGEYARILIGKAFSLDEQEKGKVKDWQFLFYKLASNNKISRLFGYLPYPITNFIANQSAPVALIVFFGMLMAGFLFISYLGILTVNITWVNLFILIGILSLWQPSRLDTVLNRKTKDNLRSKIIYFILFYIVTILLYKQYAIEINAGLMASIVIIAGVMIYTALVSFGLIKAVFAKREMVNAEVSGTGMVTYRVATQPNNILQQFDNAVQRKTGWYFKSLTKDARGLLSGDQNRKGDFEFEYIYETQPEIVSTTYDEDSERQLFKVWNIGTFLLCVGLVLFFIGVLNLPGVSVDTLGNNTGETLATYSPQILFSLYFILFGTAIYFFGNKLVYEVYAFFNTEIFFQSNLILFEAKGNYDEFEHIQGNIKRKDTSTDYTPNIKVCKVISSVFVHPYMKKGASRTSPRFLVQVDKDETMLQALVDTFSQNLSPYKMEIHSTGEITTILEVRDVKKID